MKDKTRTEIRLGERKEGGGGGEEEVEERRARVERAASRVRPNPSSARLWPEHAPVPSVSLPLFQHTRSKSVRVQNISEHPGV